MLVTDETKDIIKKFIQDLEVSIQTEVNTNMRPHDIGYHGFNEQSFKDSINYAVERLFILQQEHCD